MIALTAGEFDLDGAQVTFCKVIQLISLNLGFKWTRQVSNWLKRYHISDWAGGTRNPAAKLLPGRGEGFTLMAVDGNAGNYYSKTESPR